MHLRTKYSLSILSLMLCLVASFGGIVLIHSQSTIKALDARSSETIEAAMFQELQEKQELSVRVLAAALRNPVYQYDMQRIEEAIRALKQQPDVRHVYVYDRSGRIIHDGTKQLELYDRILEDEITRYTIETRNPTTKPQGDRLHVAMPITIEDELLGGVMVEFSLRGILAHIAQTKADLREQYQALTRKDFFVVSLIALAFGGIGFLVSVLLGRTWSRPVSQLSELMGRVGKGDYQVEIPIRRNDEIGQLARSLAQMVENLKNLREREAKQAQALQEAYEQLQGTNEKLVIANKGKDEFLGFMSHELRTPLNVVIGYAGILRDGILGEINSKQEETLEKVITLSKKLLSMVKQILEATKIEAGAIKIYKEPIDLNNLLDELRMSYSFPMSKPVHLNWVYPCDVPRLITDGEKLKHILQNLIDNAIKFTDEGHVTLSARHLSEVGAIEIRVADTGLGIPKDMIPSMFERFHQADSSDTRAHGGVGLGLYIVKKLADLLGAKIEVESERGKGSIFAVILPCSPESCQGGSLTPLEDDSHEKESLAGFDSGRAQSRCGSNLEI